jgi:hypothetical protein
MKKTVLFCLFFGLAVAAPAGAQTVDCLVAVVNGKPVTLMDFRMAREFGFFARETAERTGDPDLAVLDALIDQKVVLEVAREPVAVGGGEIGAALQAVRDRLGLGAFQSKLREFGLREEDLTSFLAEKIRYEKAVSARFNLTIPVSRGDLERYYREVYEPEQRAKGLAPEALENVGPELEARLREVLRARKVAEWIANMRSQAEIRIYKDCLAHGKEKEP